jgi:hypothetical protein
VSPPLLLLLLLLCRVHLCRSHFRELAVLLELVSRPPQVYREDPAAFEAAAAVAASLAAQTDAAGAGQTLPDNLAPPAAAAAMRTAAGTSRVKLQEQLQQTGLFESGSLTGASCATEAAAAAALSSDGECSLPWERDPMRLLVEALCRQGVKFHAALLHSSMPLLEAGMSKGREQSL